MTKPAKPGARKPAAKTPEAKKPAAPGSGSVGTTLELGRVSPLNGVGCDEEGDDAAASQFVFPNPVKKSPKSLPGPLPSVGLDDDREPSRFAQDSAPCGWLMEWDPMSGE